jgi:hypothetical protein
VILPVIGIAFAVAAFAAFASPAQDDARQKALQAVFDDLEKGIRENDEPRFKGRWHADGYEKNLCGGSGLGGKEVFGQGSRKKWFLKPDLTRTTVAAEGGVVTVFCEVWAWEKGKAVDKVEMVLVKDKDAYIVLGGGEKRADVDGLVSRWIKKEPLEAPKKAD